MRYGLFGEYDHTLDSKNRVSIPFRFREKLGERFMIVRGLSNCLFVYSMDEFEAFAEEFAEDFIAMGMDMDRFFFAGAQDVEPDKSGRVIIPQKLKDYAGIDKNVVIVGCGKRAEIWAEDAWKKAQESLTPANILARMQERNASRKA